MKVLDLLQAMEQNILGESFANSFALFFETNQVCASIEKQYTESTKWIDSHLTAAQKDVIAEVERLYNENRQYTANYGFKCGIVGAFRQFYTENNEMDSGFQTLLCDDLMKMPKMQRHQEHYTRDCRCNDLIEQLYRSLPDEADSHILNILGAWEHRIYHAAVYGFYCGYHAGYHAIECVEPHSEMKNIGKILSTEFALGFINPHTSGNPNIDHHIA